MGKIEAMFNLTETGFRFTVKWVPHTQDYPGGPVPER